MYESGYYENPQQTEVPEDSAIIVSCGTFEFLAERDGSLLLSTIQTQLPFASGLWYWSDDQQRKKAVKYDRNTSKLFPPLHGWGERTYYVSLLDNPHAGCVSGFGLDRYERATRLFQESVQSVSRLIGYEYPSANATERDTMTKFKQISDSSMPDFQSNSELQQKYDDLVQQLQTKINELNQREANEKDTESRLKEIQSQLHIAHEEVAKLENSLKEKESEKSAEIENLQRRNSELETQVEEREKKIGVQFDSTEAKFYLMENELAEKDLKIQSLNRELEECRTEMNDFQLRLRESNADVNVNEPDSNSDSFRKIIDDTTWRCAELETTVASKDQEINYLNQRNRDIENDSCRLNEELENYKKRCKQLEETVHALHQFSLHVKKQADNAKWRCGELENALKTNNVSYIDELNMKELNDAKWKCGELEAALKMKNDEVNVLIESKRSLEAELLIQKQNRDKSNGPPETDLSREKRTADLSDELASVRDQLLRAEKTLRLYEGDESTVVQKLNKKLKIAKQKNDDLTKEMETTLAAEKENFKWRQYELETALSMAKKELEETQTQASQREDQLLNEIDQKTKEILELKEIIQ